MSVHSQPDLAIGHVVAGRYRLERAVGAGGMGSVYEATQLSLARRVAVKLIKPEHAKSEGVARRFENETALLARLQHPNVVHVIDGGRGDDGELFLAMELLSGETLRKRMARVGALALKDALSIAEDIAAALVASHDAGILHRDLKPENVMLVAPAASDERAKVLDFGIARALASNPSQAPNADSANVAKGAANEGAVERHTPHGGVAGTPGYIAPEQLLSDAVDARVDLYALGVMLYEMLVGQPPFRGGSNVELMMQHLTVPAPRVATIAAARGITMPTLVDDLVAALLAKKPGERPESALVVRDALRALRSTVDVAGATQVPNLTPSQESTISSVRMSQSRPLFGRALELAELSAGLDGAQAGRGGLFFVVGEPGIGKTRLCDAFAESCARRGIDVFWGRAWEAGAAPAFYPWSEALDALLSASPEPPPAEETAWLAEIVPLLRGRVPPPPQLDPNEARFRLFAAVGNVLRRAAERRPLALLLDDLHAADAASLQLLLSVARDMRRRRLMLVGTYRDVEAELSSEAAPLLAKLAREARTIHLGRLRREDTDALVGAHAGGVVSASVGAKIYETTQGNPLFVDEVVRLLGAQGDLEEAARGPLPIPLGVRDAIRQRLERLDASVREVIEVFAVLGVEARASVAAAVAGKSVDHAARDAQRGGVLVRVDKDKLRFAHALYREELLAELDDARAIALHVRAADVLAQGSAQRPIEIADHLLAAGPEHADRAAAAALVAADVLIDTFAFEDAATLLQRALDAVPSDASARGEIAASLGRAATLAGDVVRAREWSMKAADLARKNNNAELLARAALAVGASVTPGAVDQGLVALLDEARRVLGDRPSPLVPRVLARWASAMQPSRTPSVPVARALEAFQIARTLDKRTLLDTLHEGMGALMSYHPPRDRLPLNGEVLALAEELGDAVKAQRARVRLALDAAELGRVDLLQRHVDAYAMSAAALKQSAPWRVSLLRSLVASQRADRKESERFVDEAAAIGPGVSTIALHRFYTLARTFEDPVAARAVLPAALVAIEELPDWGTLVVCALAGREGDVDAARRCLDDIRDHPLMWQSPGSVAYVADLCLMCADRDALARVDACLAVYGGTFSSVAGVAYYAEGPVDTLRARVAAALGDTQRAVTHAEDGVAQVQAGGARVHFARSALVLASELVRRGDPADRERARALTREARVDVERVPLPALVPMLHDLERA